MKLQWRKNKNIEEIFILIDTLYDDGNVQKVFKNKHFLYLTNIWARQC